MLKTYEYRLWPGEAPGLSKAQLPHEPYKETWRKEDETLVQFITEPTLQIFKPAVKKKNGTGIIICPGGGYNVLCYDKEGTVIAKRLNKAGITCGVLKYRHYSTDAALQDALRAVRLLKSMSGELGLDRNKVGIGGFSAGGHLSINTALHTGMKERRKPDAIDRISAELAFTMLVYPSLRRFKSMRNLETFPPSFMTVAADDEVTPADSTADFYFRLRKKGVGGALHIFEKGRHGFGIGINGGPPVAWPNLFIEWLKENRIL